MTTFRQILQDTPPLIRRTVEKNLEIATRIIDIMEAQGKTQSDLAQTLGRSHALVCKWLTGLHNLDLKTIYEIEDALGEEIISVVRTEISASSKPAKELQPVETQDYKNPQPVQMIAESAGAYSNKK